MTSAPRSAALLGALIAIGSPLPAQQSLGDIVREANALIRANRLDSADALLRWALDSVTERSRGERQSAWVWRAVIAHFKGNDGATSAYFRNALQYDTTLVLQGLGALSPELDSIFLEEKREAFSRVLIHDFAAVDSPPRRVSGPPIAYPRALFQRPVTGSARVVLVVDWTGRPEPWSVGVFEAPDSALIEPLKQMVLASQFTPGRHKGRPVRVRTSLRIDVRPPRFNATELVRQARSLAPRRRPDSALALLDLALSPLAEPTDAERAYALLVRGTVRAAAGDSLAAPDYRAGLAVYDSVTARGTDLAPVLRRVADSVRRAPLRLVATLGVTRWD